ncbi:MAG TPA: 30S ribosomal protein S1 [Kiritimatiellia bacterium]|nr:30S ribosomal protein S1 [Kiritimatiellia bacterium]MBP9571705.1 30S ribosomal protein S1 [Kiritimatiellia bacterium]HOE00096.1 30S ribosomal protein S1 [Kiritimatiellia bacterium]HOE37228.1 30S ribosomal protein S1 [Kiritimatiellia bacterium]HOR74609.1 30S ribosomal protein S1 [Kiritimatiellia bacterium]
MMAMYAETFKTIAEGAIVKGHVVEVRPQEVLVNIGYKSEGLLAASEFKDLSEVHVGDEVEVYLERLEDEHGMVVLSKTRAEQQRNWDNVTASCEEGKVVTGLVKGKVKGGLLVDVGGVDAFLPGSQIDVVPARNLDDYLGQSLECKVIKINKERRNIVLSRRDLIEETRREQKKKLLQEIQPGQTRRGVVKNITEFGAFVDLNGMDGLLHITDMSWGRINHPSEVVQVGDELEVVVLDVNLDKERISLGLKQKQQNPWEEIELKYPKGTRIRGKVVNLVPYGAFVQLEDGVEGLVHVSEISWTKRVARAADALSVGQEVDAVVLNVNKEEQKISLGIRQTEVNPWDDAAAKYPIGSRVKGKVRNFTNYGAFVELEEGVDGMIHVSDMSWARKVSHPNEVLKKGDEVEAIVLEVSPENQRISLGLKQAQEDPWAGISNRYRIGQLIKGKVSKLASFGAFVELEEGVDGLVHISQISDDHVTKIRDVLQPGQEVEARVIKIDPIDRRIGLSIKAAKLPEEDFKVDDSMLEGLRAGEDLVDLAGAFDAALSSSDKNPEEWSPGASQKE